MNTVHLLICAIILLFSYIYYVFKKAYSYFDQNGIPNIKPTFFFGNVKDWILMRKALPIIHFDLYKQLEPHRFVGVFASMTKSILIRDPVLIRNILTKDFAYFHDRRVKKDSDVNNIMNQNLFMLTGEDWKNLRIKLTGTFTASKMKMTLPLVKKCGNKLSDILNTSASNEEEFDVKDLCSRYTTDVIGSCAFGLDINSLENPDSEFREMGKRIFKIKFRTIVRALYPNLVKYFKSILTDLSVQNFFSKLVRETVKHREDNKITREDFLNILITLKNRTSKTNTFHDKNEEADLQKFYTQVGTKQTNCDIEMTVDLMSAQCFIFFVASVDTSSSTLSYMLLELAQNQPVQDKLRDEIITVLENNDNQLTYEVLKQMKYLDMVIAETLRRYPVTGNLIRVCTEPYKIPDTEVVIDQGTPIVISILGIHHDVKYYEKPNEFYPEHFTEEAKAARLHYTYLPFGEGPRACIGGRFAKVQIKIGAINLIKNFSYQLSPRTKLPVEFTPGSTIMDIKGGIWLKCRKL